MCRNARKSELNAINVCLLKLACTSGCTRLEYSAENSVSAHSFWRNCYKSFCSAQANKGFLLTCNGVDHKSFCGPLLAKMVQVFLYRQGQTSTLADPCEDVKRTDNLPNTLSSITICNIKWIQQTKLEYKSKNLL